jgi:hypothetical protein
MAFRFLLARHPTRPRHRRHLIIDDFLNIARASKKVCLRKMIEMTQDLRKFGLDSRYVKPLGGPLYELKDRTSDGGARVYFLRYGTDAFILGRAECKNENAADDSLLSSLLDIMDAIERNPALID